MVCTECGIKFKEKYASWPDDQTVVCPVCKARITVLTEPEKPEEQPVRKFEVEYK